MTAGSNIYSISVAVFWTNKIYIYQIYELLQAQFTQNTDLGQDFEQIRVWKLYFKLFVLNDSW